VSLHPHLIHSGCLEPARAAFRTMGLPQDSSYRPRCHPVRGGKEGDKACLSSMPLTALNADLPERAQRRAPRQLRSAAANP
jgi:hypothetical protein